MQSVEKNPFDKNILVLIISSCVKVMAYSIFILKSHVTELAASINLPWYRTKSIIRIQ